MRVNKPVLDLNVGEKNNIHLFFKTKQNKNANQTVSAGYLVKIKGQFLQCPHSVHALGHVNNGNPIIFLQ